MDTMRNGYISQLQINKARPLLLPTIIMARLRLRTLDRIAGESGNGVRGVGGGADMVKPRRRAILPGGIGERQLDPDWFSTAPPASEVEDHYPVHRGY